jgi:hypothetical protein
VTLLWLSRRSVPEPFSEQFDCLPRQARCVRWLAALAAMFAGEPPSSSNPTKRMCRRISSVLDSFRRLRLQIGGANIAGADRAWRPLSSSLARSSQHGGAPAVREFAARSFVQTAAHDPSMISPSP